MDIKSRLDLRKRLTLSYTILIVIFGIFVVWVFNMGIRMTFEKNTAFNLPKVLVEVPNEIQFQGRGGRDILLNTIAAKEVFTHTYEIFLENQENNLTRIRNISYLMLIPYSVFAYAVGYKMTDEILKPSEEATDKQKQFVADASHELKTPLTKVQTHIDVLLDRDGDGKVSKGEYKETVTLLRQFGQEMNTLTEDLLLLSKTLPFDKKDIKLEALAVRLVENYKVQAEEKGLKLKYIGEGKVPDIQIKGHLPLLERAISNLIENSIRYTDKGEVTVDIGKSGGHPYITITDTGIGISEDHIDTIFERFFRVDKSRSRTSGGSGLGLSIVKKILDEHGFTIGVKSKRDEGSEFKILF